jgi:DNA-binding beta-propeller fold protein YncE
VSVGGQNVWVANKQDGTVSQIEVEGERVRTLAVGSSPSGVAADAGTVWVAVQAS